MRPVIPLVLLWTFAGELAALGLAAVLPRHVFPVGLESPWPALAGLGIVLALSKREERIDAMDRLRPHLAAQRRVLLLPGALIVLPTVVVDIRCPAGVDVEIDHPNGARIALGRRPDFDQGR